MFHSLAVVTPLGNVRELMVGNKKAHMKSVRISLAIVTRLGGLREFTLDQKSSRRV